MYGFLPLLHKHRPLRKYHHVIHHMNQKRHGVPGMTPPKTKPCIELAFEVKVDERPQQIPQIAGHKL